MGIECKSGLMQRPERIILVGTSAVACGIISKYLGDNYKWHIKGIPFHLFETITIFTLPIAIMAILTNITAYHRLMEAKRALEEKDKLQR